MAHDTFLSVDIDYFNDCPSQLGKFLGWLEINIPLSVSVVTSHYQMLAKVNKSSASVLLNIDAHSDLASCDVPFLNCGTWVSYVSWRDEGRYIWIRPERSYEGECNGGDNIFEPGSEATSDWREYKSYYVPIKSLISSRRVWKDINAISVCFCVSPNYANKEVKDIFRAWMKMKQLKATPGSDYYEIDGLSPQPPRKRTLSVAEKVK
jgi:hypothetical protein